MPNAYPQKESTETETLPLPIPDEFDRVRSNTAPQVLQKVDRKVREDLLFLSAQSKAGISRRIEELDREWPIDRALMTGAAVNVLLGLLLGRTVNRAWYLFPAVVAGFLLQHTLQGWCPPLSVLRRLGLRTAKEIALERNALKALRGDYGNIHEASPDFSSRAGLVDKVLLAAA